MQIVNEQTFRSSTDVTKDDDMVRVTLDMSKNEWKHLKGKTEEERLEKAFTDFYGSFTTAMGKARGWKFTPEQVKIIDKYYNDIINPMRPPVGN